MTTWQLDGGRIRCTKHDVSFERTEICPSCALEPPATAPRVEASGDPPKPPVGCYTSEQWEKWFSDVAGTAERLAADLAKYGADGKKKLKDGKIGKTPREHSACAKYLELAVKAAARASEMTLRREDEHLVRERENRLRERGHGVH